MVDTSASAGTANRISETWVVRHFEARNDEKSGRLITRYFIAIVVAVIGKRLFAQFSGQTVLFELFIMCGTATTGSTGTTARTNAAIELVFRTLLVAVRQISTAVMIEMHAIR